MALILKGGHDKVIEAGVLHSGENPSNHSPIFAKIAFGDIDNSTEKIKTNRRADWDKSTAEARALYVTSLSNKLEQLVSWVN